MAARHGAPRLPAFKMLAPTGHHRVQPLRHALTKYHRRVRPRQYSGDALEWQKGCQRLACTRALNKEDGAVAVGDAKTDIRTLFSDIPKSGATKLHRLLLVTVHRHADLPLPVQEAFHRGPWQACRSSPAQTRTKAMRLRPRAALRHSQGVGVRAPPSRCLSDRATRKAVLQRPDYITPVRSTEATHAFSGLSTHYWFTA